MSEDNENKAQEAPEASAPVQLEETEGSVQQSAESTPAEATASSQEEKLILSQEEYDAKAAKIKAIAERRAKREVEAKYAEEMSRFKAQYNDQKTTQNNFAQGQPPSPDYIWDNNLGWIHKDMSVQDYSSMVGQALTQLNIPGSTAAQQAPAAPSSQPVQQSQHQPNEAYGGLSQQALEQIDECIVEYNDFKATAAQIITPAMANAAAMAPDGLKMLYELHQENPLELYKMTQLSPDEQKFKVWELQKEKAVKAQKKVVTNATPQPEPLETNGTVRRYEDLSIADRKALRLKEQWENN